MRLWLIVSAVWIIGLSALILPTDIGHQKRDPWRDMVRDEYAGCNLSKRSYQCDPELVTPAICSAHAGGPWCDYLPPEGRKLDDLDLSYRTKTALALRNDLYTIFLPPLALFLLESGLAWVLAGFKSS